MSRRFLYLVTGVLATLTLVALFVEQYGAAFLFSVSTGTFGHVIWTEIESDTEQEVYGD